ncbi:amino acid transporter [Sinomonas atrocyanea]|uniref:APC family permease n=1 Tax=Sinomonas atrocyanea TaxID=37927 RepID=UPI002781EBF0|nr:APC family permease [Sinomonas atrocyanea]MDP9886194.1 amino acid transporter [Sinomonas atrocyanea]
MAQEVVTPTHGGHPLKRVVGFWGLMFVSLGSIIGSGWLLGALGAAKSAGPASIISWLIAAVMLIVLALIHADLGAAYPVAGGTARYPLYAFGALAGFSAGWVGYLQAVTIAPIEVEGAITYLESAPWAKGIDLVNADSTLTPVGLLIAVLALAVFTVVNLLGAKWLSDSNIAVVIWKAAVPALTIVVIIALTFHPQNFSQGAGGFAPHGVHGIFAALPLGVVFALQGFEQAAQMAGEARNPKKDVARAIITAMLIGAAVYILLEVAFIGAINPANVAQNWDNPLGAGAFGPYYDLALAAGAGWLATVLLIDAVVSPFGTGLVYIGTSARISYALGEDDALPPWLTSVSKRGVPFGSIVLAFVIGLIALLPFPSWQSLVGLVTDATAIMYAFAPVSLEALIRQHAGREHPYRVPWPQVLTPFGFVAANLIIYWSGFEAIWKILTAILIGRVIFEIALHRSKSLRFRRDLDWRAASWIWPWLIGLVVLGLLGRYGTGSLNILPEWVDILFVVGFSLVIFYYAVSLAMKPEDIAAAVGEDEFEFAAIDAPDADAPTAAAADAAAAGDPDGPRPPEGGGTR